MAPVVLRENLNLDEDSWIFGNIKQPGPPKHPKADKLYGKMIAFTHEKITLSIGELPSNRILRADDHSKFILVSFGGFRFPNEPFKATGEYMMRLFSKGFFLNGVQYRFYHHSNSQLVCQ
jgi:hypothetical protein